MRIPPTSEEVLNTPMADGHNDAGAATIRDYLKMLLLRLWIDGESFSGKRPLGNSGWKFDLYIALIKAGHLEGTFDEDDYLDEFSTTEQYKGNRWILEAIEHMGTRKA